MKFLTESSIILKLQLCAFENGRTNKGWVSNFSGPGLTDGVKGLKLAGRVFGVQRDDPFR